MDTTDRHTTDNNRSRQTNRLPIRPRIRLRPTQATLTVEATVDAAGTPTAPPARNAAAQVAKTAQSAHSAKAPRRPAPSRAPDEVLRRTLNTAGWLEIVLFGLPLIFAGRRVARYVKEHDPHIYKEYGVARIVMGLAFLMGARQPQDRKAIARIGSVFYGCNIIVSLVDLALANVANVELAVVVLSTALSAALGRLSARSGQPRDMPAKT